MTFLVFPSMQRLSTALATASSQHAMSIILNTFSFPPFHAILPPYYSSSSSISPFPSLYMHISSQSDQYPPPLHFHIPYTPYISSLLKPCQLQISIPNSAVPPLNLAILLLCLLQSIPTQWALQSLSMRFPVISNFELPCSFSLQTALIITLRHTVFFNSCFTHLTVNPSNATTFTPIHPSFSKLCCKPFTYLTLLSISKASSITTFTNLSSFILITAGRPTDDASPPLKRFLLSASVPFPLDQAALHIPMPLYTPYNNTDSTSISKSLTNVAPFTSPTAALHLLSQPLSAFAPAFTLSSTILTFYRYSSTTQPRYLYSSTTLISSPPT